VLVVVLVVWGVITGIRRNRRGLVAERGTSIGADLGALSDQPVVRVRTLTREGPGHYLLVLTPEPGPDDAPVAQTSPDIEMVVNLTEDQFGFDLLREWERSKAPIAMVIPPESRLVRLRSIDDLQPLTLSRVDRE